MNGDHSLVQFIMKTKMFCIASWMGKQKFKFTTSCMVIWRKAFKQFKPLMPLHNIILIPKILDVSVTGLGIQIFKLIKVKKERMIFSRGGYVNM